MTQGHLRQLRWSFTFLAIMNYSKEISHFYFNKKDHHLPLTGSYILPQAQQWINADEIIIFARRYMKYYPSF